VCIADRTAPLSVAVTSGRFLDPYRTDPEINRWIGVIFDVPPA